MQKYKLILLLFLLNVFFCFAQDEPEDLKTLRQSYPDVEFVSYFDDTQNDWKITVIAENRSADLYWQEGRLLPKGEIKNKDKYWPISYHYPKEIPDPKNFTKEDIERIRKFSSSENRLNGPGTPPFFYEAIYDCKSERAVEKHIVSTTFLGKKTRVHKRILEPLKKVEQKILKEAKTDKETAFFVNQLNSADAFYWREIRDTNRISFHAVGIAIDVLPKGWQQKNLYWSWRRDIDPKNWMKLPLERRWMPSMRAIEIFEEEGFIWGGKWAIWDNMHFEYHPEQVLNLFSKN